MYKQSFLSENYEQTLPNKKHKQYNAHEKHKLYLVKTIIELSIVNSIPTANNLLLNLYKINIMKFITKNSSHSTLHISFAEKGIERQRIQNFLVTNL
jgi:hypothetical protein